MAFDVVLSPEAERDIEDIYRHIAAHDSVTNADRVLIRLERTIAGLAELPARGNVPKELQRVGIADFREAHFKPYRIIYRVEGRRVVIHGVVDGRRDMRTFLQRRLLLR